MHALQGTEISSLKSDTPMFSNSSLEVFLVSLVVLQNQSASF